MKVLRRQGSRTDGQNLVPEGVPYAPFSSFDVR